jgi:hypothetical protein
MKRQGGVFPHKLLSLVDIDIEDLNIARRGGVFPQKLLKLVDDEQERQRGGIPNNQLSFVDLDSEKVENKPREVEKLRKRFEEKLSERKTPGKILPKKTLKKTARKLSTPRKNQPPRKPTRKPQPKLRGNVKNLVDWIESSSGNSIKTPTAHFDRKMEIPGKIMTGNGEPGTFEFHFGSKEGDRVGTGRSLKIKEINPFSAGSRLGYAVSDQWERARQTGPRHGRERLQTEGGDWTGRLGWKVDPPTTEAVTSQPGTSYCGPATTAGGTQSDSNHSFEKGLLG